MKLCNFLRLDPSYPGAGLNAGGRLEETVWAEFAHDREHLHEVARAITAAVETDALEVLPLPEDDEFEAPEGEVLLRLHKTRERSASLNRRKKAQALQQFGTLRCEVCDFDFRERYGELGEGFIECHHTIPLAQLPVGHMTRLTDLTLVCANCHRMLHRGGSLQTVEMLRLTVHGASSRSL